MMDGPLISVIVPVYKVEAYLDRCVQSIVDQTYSNLEIILVDDGSPDNCPALCDAWAEQDSRIKVIHKENGGGAQARNAGIDTASGAFLAFVDSDDFLFPIMYETLLNAAQTHNCAIAECDFYPVFSDDFPSEPGPAPQHLILDTEAALRENIKDQICRQLVWNKLYRAEAIGGIRFTEGKFIDDEFFTYQVLGNATRTVVLNQKLYCYRQQPESVMHQAYSLKRLDALEAKLQRVLYIDQHYPYLAGLARYNLWFSAMYAMQMSLRHLSAEECLSAHGKISAILQQCGTKVQRASLPLRQQVWILLSRIWFLGACKLRNKLGIGL